MRKHTTANISQECTSLCLASPRSYLRAGDRRPRAGAWLLQFLLNLLALHILGPSDTRLTKSHSDGDVQGPCAPLTAPRAHKRDAFVFM